MNYPVLEIFVVLKEVLVHLELQALLRKENVLKERRISRRGDSIEHWVISVSSLVEDAVFPFDICLFKLHYTHMQFRMEYL
jgi:hypothetical protein